MNSPIPSPSEAAKVLPIHREAAKALLEAALCYHEKDVIKMLAKLFPAPAPSADEELRRLAERVCREGSEDGYWESVEELRTYLDATPSVPAPQEVPDESETMPCETPEALEDFLITYHDVNSQWLVYRAGVAHGENAQHPKSSAEGYRNGWRDGRLPLNNPAPTDPCASELASLADSWTKEVGERPPMTSTDLLDCARSLRSALTRYRQRSSPANGAEGKK